MEIFCCDVQTCRRRDLVVENTKQQKHDASLQNRLNPDLFVLMTSYMSSGNSFTHTKISQRTFSVSL